MYKRQYHTYAGEVKSVRGVSFDLKEGEAIAIVGESGCGKSVTAKSIMGLIKGPQGEIKQGSEILYHGDNILNYNKKQWQAYKGGEVAIIFQDALASLNPTLSLIHICICHVCTALLSFKTNSDASYIAVWPYIRGCSNNRPLFISLEYDAACIRRTAKKCICLLYTSLRCVCASCI